MVAYSTTEQVMRVRSSRLFEQLERRHLLSNTPLVVFDANASVNYTTWDGGFGADIPRATGKDPQDGNAPKRGTEFSADTGEQSHSTASRSFSGRATVNLSQVREDASLAIVHGNMSVSITTTGGGIFGSNAQISSGFVPYVLGVNRAVKLTVETRATVERTGSVALTQARAYSAFGRDPLVSTQVVYGIASGSPINYGGETYSKIEFGGVSLSNGGDNYFGYSILGGGPIGTETVTITYRTTYLIEDNSPKLTVFPETLDLGTLQFGRTRTRTITIQNTGTVDSVLTGNVNALFAKEGTGELTARILSGGGSFSLKGGERRQVNLQGFNEGTSGGIHIAILPITSNDPTRTNVDVEVKVRIPPPTLTLISVDDRNPRNPRIVFETTGSFREVTWDFSRKKRSLGAIPPGRHSFRVGNVQILSPNVRTLKVIGKNEGQDDVGDQATYDNTYAGRQGRTKTRVITPVVPTEGYGIRSIKTYLGAAVYKNEWSLPGERWDRFVTDVLMIATSTVPHNGGDIRTRAGTEGSAFKAFSGSVPLSFAATDGIGSDEFWSDSWGASLNDFAKSGQTVISASPTGVITFDRGIPGSVLWGILGTDPKLVIE